MLVWLSIRGHVAHQYLNKSAYRKCYFPQESKIALDSP